MYVIRLELDFVRGVQNMKNDGISREKISLRHCWEWECPTCGRYNLCHGTKVSCPIDPEDTETRADLVKMGMMDPEHPDDGWVMAPNVVVCPACKDEFEPFEDEGEVGSDG